MVRALGGLERGALTLTPQPTVGVTYAPKIDKAETRIDWTRAWQAVHDHCRGLSPFPGSWFELPGGQGAVRLIEQAAGAVLIERAIPGDDLVAMATAERDDEATGILCDVMAKLNRPPPAHAPFRTIVDWGKGFARNRIAARPCWFPRTP